jgi:ribosome-binding protein aMBF1 (putative translation factor)
MTQDEKGRGLGSEKREFGKRFAQLVKDRRVGLGLSQNELAGRSGITRTQITNIERRGSCPSFHLAVKLCVFLNINLAQHFGADIRVVAKESP